ncbi:hypothetical protein [Flavobacterium sp.]
MELVKDYLPAVIEFTAKTVEVPDNLGAFETPEDVQKFMSENFVAMSEQVETDRLIDDFEKEHIRDEYIKELEDRLPEYQERYLERAKETEQAKDAEKMAKESVNASLNKVETLAREVKKGTTEINLDAAVTYKVPHNGSYFFYTYIDGQLKLAKVKKIPDHELGDLFNSSERNKTYFDGIKKAKKAK